MRVSIQWVAAFLSILVGPVAAQDSGPSMFADPALKEALSAIQAKGAEVNDYTCVIEIREKGTQDGTPYENVGREELGFRRPNSYYAKVQRLQDNDPAVAGSLTRIIGNSEIQSRYIVNAPGSGQHAVKDPDNAMTAEEKAKAIRDHETPHIDRYDFARLRSAGLPKEIAAMLDSAALGVRPLTFLDDYKDRFEHDGIRLVSQDDASWVLECRMSGDLGDEDDEGQVATVTIDKSDGIVRKIEFAYNGNPDRSKTYTVSEIKVNAGLPDTVFDSTPPPGIPVADKVDEIVSGIQTATMDALKAMNPTLAAIQWQEGPTRADVGGIAHLQLPAGYVFANGSDTATLLESFGNLVTDEPLGMFAPKTLDWFVVFFFDDVGYVKDDEKDELDPDAMLKSMRNNNETANKMRKEAGLETLELVGWAVEPRYDEATHNVEWALRLKDEADHITVNHHTRYLGRTGIMNVTYVGDPESLSDRLPVFKERMREFAFAQGNRYDEYRAGDRVAQFGLSALVVGGAAALAVKTGLFKYLWKLIILVVAVLGGGLKAIFGRKSTK
ncbi:DUF2167 domain-containing protein [Candidatus Sumerlaeota bacterium]|nr:DUF2167 domain-containing protein [Candidatus Sumerlaeota bacterium]